MSGCASRGNVDLLESELRQNESVRAELEHQISRLETDLRVARTDADALRSSLAKSGGRPPAAEDANALYRAVDLKFFTLMTGGWDRDAAPGDEGIMVALTPVDEHGDLVKLPGDVEIELFDMTRDGDDQRLGIWRLSAEEVRASWYKGLIGSGFVVRLPWQRRPGSEKLTLHARFKTADDRRFDATTQLTVTPPGAMLAENAAEPPPSKYRISAQPISMPRAKSNEPVTAPGSDEPGKTLPAPIDLTPGWGDDDLDPIVVDNSPDGESEEADSDSASEEDSAILESDSWTEESIPVLR